MDKKKPTISVVIATFNSEETLDKCLQSIKNQKYPQKNIEIILADGSSKDRTLKIGKKYNTRIISIPLHLQNAEYNKSIGVENAKGDYLLMLDHDNILPHKNWLEHMIAPLQKYKDVVGVDTAYITYDKTATILNRYLALFGSLDPVAYYLKKSDKLSIIDSTYKGLGKVKNMKDYYIVSFNPKFVPSLGANGFLTRRKLLIKHANTSPSHFFHTDVHVDLIRKGFNTYAFIKDDITHLVGYQNIWGFLKRRKMFLEQYNITKNHNRRHSVFLPQDTGRLVLFIIYTLTIIKPTFDAAKGYSKIHDIAWFLHPFLCVMFLIIYGYVISKNYIFSTINKKFKKLHLSISL